MDVVNKISEFFDNHIKLIQNVGYGIVGVGVAIIVRKSRLFTKFKSASEIPDDFIHKRIKLRGIVRDILPHNIVQVDHVPSLSNPAANLIKRFQKQPSGNGLISLGMAGVSMDEAGIDAMKSEIEGKAVWFELLDSVNPEDVDAHAPAVIYIRRMAFLRNFNIYAVKMGYGVAEQLPDCYHTKFQQSLQRSLLKAQKAAAAKRRGVWKE